MDKFKVKILMLVEGAKTDVRLMKHLLNIYGLDDGHEIVSYNTNIYTLYRQMFSEHDPDAYDLLQVLKAREKDPKKKAIFDQSFSDIIRVFDLDPQDPEFSEEKIREMVAYFRESSDMGKLYLNYPMVESFYHMKTIPDPKYYTYTVSLFDLRTHQYKQQVSRFTGDQRKFAQTKAECSAVIRQNIEKSKRLTGQEERNINLPPNQEEILNVQMTFFEETELIQVLCTCPFYIVDYNPNLLDTP